MNDIDQTPTAPLPLPLPPVMQAFMDEQHWPEMDHWLDCPKAYSEFAAKYLQDHPELVIS